MRLLLMELLSFVKSKLINKDKFYLESICAGGTNAILN